MPFTWKPSWDKRSPLYHRVCVCVIFFLASAPARCSHLSALPRSRYRPGLTRLYVCQSAGSPTETSPLRHFLLGLWKACLTLLFDRLCSMASTLSVTLTGPGLDGLFWTKKQQYLCMYLPTYPSILIFWHFASFSVREETRDLAGQHVFLITLRSSDSSWLRKTIIMLEQTPHSPDLTLIFFCFPQDQGVIKGTRSEDSEGINMAVTMEVAEAVKILPQGRESMLVCDLDLIYFVISDLELFLTYFVSNYIRISNSDNGWMNRNIYGAISTSRIFHSWIDSHFLENLNWFWSITSTLRRK